MENEYFYLNSMIIWVLFCQVQAAICRSMPSLNIDLITTFGNSFPIFIYTSTIHILKSGGAERKKSSNFSFFLVCVGEIQKHTRHHSFAHSQPHQLISVLCCGRRLLMYFSAHLAHVDSAHYCRCSASNSLFCFRFNCVFLIFIRKNVKIEDIFPFLGCERWTFIWPHKLQDTFFLSPRLHSICSWFASVFTVHTKTQQQFIMIVISKQVTRRRWIVVHSEGGRVVFYRVNCKSYIDTMPMTASLTRNNERNQKKHILKC